MSPRGRPLASAIVLAAAMLASGCGGARAEPPLRGPEDAACRLEARAQVFTAPNPRGLELEEIGRGIYDACMARLGGRSAKPKRRHRR